MTPDQLLQILQDFGPALLSVVGTMLGGVIALVGYLGNLVWKSHNQRMSRLTKCIGELAHAVKEQDQIQQALRTELQLTAQKWDHIKMSLMGCEANIKSQENKIVEHIKELAKIDSKFDAVFRILDPPRRASDLK